MLSVSPIRGNGRYYTELARSEYYTKGGEPPGIWHGRRLAEIGVAEGQSIVGNDQLRNFLNGFRPTDKQSAFVKNPGTKRFKGYDNVFEAEKDVSIFYAASNSYVRRIVEQTHTDAVKAALRYRDQHAVFTRRGAQGEKVEPASGVYALFNHVTNRLGHMHLHTHVLDGNVVVRADGTTGTYFGQVIKDANGNTTDAINPALEHNKAIGAIYRMQFASLLQERLGLSIERSEDGWSFRLKGVPKDARENYSERAREIEAAARAKGYVSDASKRLAALETRKAKQDINRPELFKKWKSELHDQFHFSENDAEKLCFQHQPTLDKSKTLRDAVAKSISDLIDSNNRFLASDLYERVANSLVGTGIGYDEMSKFLSEVIESEDHSQECGLVSLGYSRCQRVLTTQDTLNREYDFAAILQEAAKSKSHVVDSVLLEEAISATENKSNLAFSEKYRSALQYLTTGQLKDNDNVGDIRVLIGKAGSGKTTLLGTAKEAFQKAGYRCVGAALSGKASDILESETGIRSATLAKWKYELEKTGFDRAKRVGKQISRAARGLLTYKPTTFCRFDAKTVFFLDESSMAETADLLTMVKKARKKGALVILCGDEKQIQAIGQGGAFKAAIQQTKAVCLDENYRQRNDSDKQLVKLVSEGKGKQALEDLFERERLHIRDNIQETINYLVETWQRKGGEKKPKHHQIFVAKNDDRLTINQLCQERRVGQIKRLLGPSANNHEGQLLFSGDRIIFRENLSLHGQYQGFREATVGSFIEKLTLNAQGIQKVWNGQQGTILNVNPLKGSYRVKMDDGRLLTVPMKIRDESKKTLGFYHRHWLSGKHLQRPIKLSLGYAITTHQGQGASVENSYILAGGSMQDRELSYVQMSRHRNACHVFTTAALAGPYFAAKALRRELHSQGRQTEANAVATHGISKFSLLATQMSRSRTKELAIEMQVQSNNNGCGVPKSKRDLIKRQLERLRDKRKTVSREVER